MRDKDDIIRDVVVTLVTAVVMLFASFLNFGLGYVGGVVLKLTVGNIIVECLNTVFATTRFTVDLIPTLCGIIGYIATEFKPTIKTNEK